MLVRTKILRKMFHGDYWPSLFFGAAGTELFGRSCKLFFGDYHWQIQWGADAVKQRRKVNNTTGSLQQRQFNTELFFSVWGDMEND